MHLSQLVKVSFVATLSVVVGCSTGGDAEVIETDGGAPPVVNEVDGRRGVDAVAPMSGDASVDVALPPTSERGPAYTAGTAGCPAADGERHIKMVNNCAEPRWFKLDGRTTPTWARPTTCPWQGETCTDLDGTTQCGAIAKAKSGGVETGTVYCKGAGGGAGTCACNPDFELLPGESKEIALPANASFPSGTGWLATGCNALGAKCSIGDSAARNSTFEWSYDVPGKGALYYDMSAVNAWTSVSAIGMKTCGGAPNPADKFRCGGAGCRFDVATQCPDGTANHPAATGPSGASANFVLTGTVFNKKNIGGPEWTWNGAPDFATKFGFDEGAHANRRSENDNVCLGGCDLCTTTRGVSPEHPDCLKYCCPDVTKSYDGASYRYDSAGCTALGVQKGTDYTAALKAECPYVYTYGYEDHSSTFICDTAASLLVQACPDATDFPGKLP